MLERRARAPASIAALIAGKGSGGSVLQLRRFARRILADEVGPGGQRLAELDRGRADRLERRGIIGLGGHAQAEARDAAQPAHLRRGQRIALDALQRAVPRQRPAPLAAARDGSRAAVKSSTRLDRDQPAEDRLDRWLGEPGVARSSCGRRPSRGKRRIDSTR